MFFRMFVSLIIERGNRKLSHDLIELVATINLTQQTSTTNGLQYSLVMITRVSRHSINYPLSDSFFLAHTPHMLKRTIGICQMKPYCSYTSSL